MGYCEWEYDGGRSYGNEDGMAHDVNMLPSQNKISAHSARIHTLKRFFSFLQGHLYLNLQ